MTQTTQFTIGAEASCSDGVGGEVTRVVIDPVAQAVTHLVVEPKHQHASGRLVPVGLVRSGTGEIRLGCTLAEFDELDPAVETHFLADDGGSSGYGPGQAYVWPYYGLAGGMSGGMGMGMGMGLWAGGASIGTGTAGVAGPVTTDTVPDGDVAVHRGDRVHATDGEIGHVRGMVIGTASHRVTHVLLHEGRLFSRKDVAIPISAVTRFGDSIQLNIGKQQVEDLPSVDLDRSGDLS